MEKTRRFDSRPLGQTSMIYGPPAVVRLDSGGGENDGDNTMKDMDVPPPSYAFEQPFNPNASTIALPYSQPVARYTNTQGHRTQSDLGREYDPEPEFYSSPFEDAEPEHSTTAASLPANASSLTSTPKPGTMTKSRWGLKLQLHAAQSMPSLPTGDHLHAGLSDTVATAQANPMVGANVETDVFRHAYNYPLAKQLSPIAEQDYFSRAVDSDSRSMSLRFGRADFSDTSGSGGKPSPAGSGSGSSREGVKGKKEKGNDGGTVEKESLKTRTGSSRAGSGSSVGTANGMSRTGSASMGVTGAQNASPGASLGDISRPSPVYASPFITRHLNRTVSQTSSKSDPPSQPTGAQTPQASPQVPAQIPIHLQGLSRAGTANNVSTPSAPRSTTHSNPNKGNIQTPTSASTTGTGSATMYTPTSTLQTPTAKTPGTPNLDCSNPIQHPPAAATTSTTTMVFPLPPQSDLASHLTPRLPKIPSLPAMAPLDLRFSLLGSVSPRARREVRTPHTGGTPIKAGGAAERMPVIDGSVEGYDEDDDYDDEDYDDIRVVIEGEEYDAEEYERESLHAESFVTAGSKEDVGSNDKANNHQDLEQGVELATLSKPGHKDLPPSSTSHYARPKDPLSLSASSTEPTHVHDSGLGSSAPDSATGESFIHKRWDRDALGFGPPTSSPTFQPKGGNLRWPLRFSSSSSSLTPAFWTFWLGFICPFLWLVGGWHFTNAGELPPKLTVWEWYFWKSGWSVGGCFRAVGDKLFFCTAGGGRRASQGGVAREVRGSQGDGAMGEQQPARRNGGKRRSSSQAKARSGKLYPALPRWVAEKQSTDDGRMRLNDPKRSLRGISFGYPFISRLQTSQDSYNSKPPQHLPSSSSLTVRILKRIGEILSKPNRVLDMLYGVKLREVRGRPESGRRMFDPWIQRCRYALCYGMALLAIGLCIASTYLIIVSTRKLV
ncbi:hypothetical protein M413DRAFT_152250 [Hebeloma cylindrosporum]|uniref:Uncharacterized protein n=1 Tax=Hebeloma cylindrosporum TaxID=76867 RepID=A0A0C3CBN1_HEBCY|nr:hypothetical protein M413DRAFT_152250 [Hebeloma cylindrosporum h7]